MAEFLRARLIALRLIAIQPNTLRSWRSVAHHRFLALVICSTAFYTRLTSHVRCVLLQRFGPKWRVWFLVPGWKT